MRKQPKSSFELAMERLRAADPAGAKPSPLNAKQKDEIAEARLVATARLAEREILFKDALKRTHDRMWHDEGSFFSTKMPTHKVESGGDWARNGPPRGRGRR